MRPDSERLLVSKVEEVRTKITT